MSPGEAFEMANITTEEADRFVKQFQDPNFRQLFEDYAKEISDPKAKAEHDAYLAQIEADGQAEAIYGKGVQLIVPEPGLVFKTKDITGRIRVYVNVCTSSKMEQFSEQRSSDPVRPGVHLTLPTALHSRHPKVSSTADGVAVHVWDLALHPAALQQATMRPSLMETIITIAIERVETVSGIKLLRRYKMPKTTYKTLPGHEKPSVMSVRTSDAVEVIDGRLRPQAESKRASQAAAVDTSNTSDSRCCNVATRANQPHQKSSRSSFVFHSSDGVPDIQQQQALLAASPCTAGYIHECGAVTPKWDLVERGCVDLGQAWQDRGLGPAHTTPQALVLRVELPGTLAATAVQLDVNRDSLQLQVPGKYLLNLQLRHLVKHEDGTAKYDKVKQLLTITLPVLQLTSAPQLHAQQQQQLGAPDVHAADQRGHDILQQQKLEEQHHQDHQHHEQQQQQQLTHSSSSHNPTSTVASGKNHQGTAKGHIAVHVAAEAEAASVMTATCARGNIEVSQTLTANQLQWKQLHTQVDSEQQQQQHDQQVASKQLWWQAEEAGNMLAKPLTPEQQDASLLKPRLQGRQLTASMLD